MVSLRSVFFIKTGFCWFFRIWNSVEYNAAPTKSQIKSTEFINFSHFSHFTILGISVSSLICNSKYILVQN